MLCTEVSGNINDPSSVIALQRRLGAPLRLITLTLSGTRCTRAASW